MVSDRVRRFVISVVLAVAAVVPVPAAAAPADVAGSLPVGTTGSSIAAAASAQTPVLLPVDPASVYLSVVHVDDDGSFVVAGEITTSQSPYRADGLVAWLNPDGTLDTTRGPLVIPAAALGARYMSIRGIAPGPDGRLYLAVSGTTSSTDGGMYVAAVGPDGLLEPGFSGDGIASVGFWGTAAFAYDVAATPEGKVVVGGSTHSSQYYIDSEIVLARFDSDGSLDGSFGNGGRVVTPYTYSRVTDIEVDSQGRLVAVGETFNESTWTWDDLVLRYTPGGALDGTFGSGGVVAQEAPRNGGVFLDSSDRPIATGQTAVAGSVASVQRFTSSGIPDASFGSGGIVALDGFGWVSSGYVDTNGRIVVLGANEMQPVRLTGSGELDTSYGSGGVGPAPPFEEPYGQHAAAHPAGGTVGLGYSGSGLDLLTWWNDDGALNGSFGTGGVVTIGVSLPNSAPIADAGPDVSVAWSDVVHADGRAVVPLDGTASYDPDGDPLRYFWVTDFGHGPDHTVTSTKSQPDLIARRVGVFEVELYVSDGRGGTGYDTLTVEIYDGSPNGGIGSTVTLDPPLRTAGGAIAASFTAEVLGPGGEPLEGVSLTVDIEGPNHAAFASNGRCRDLVALDIVPCVTGADGRVAIAFNTNSLPGTDLVSVHADIDGDNYVDPTEPVGTAEILSYEPLRYAALGDSFSSGEGIPPFEAGTDTASNQCHRSTAAYARLVQPPNRSTRAASTQLGSSFRFLACSGARTYNVAVDVSPEPGEGSKIQFNEPGVQVTRIPDDVNLITMSIGGNDAKFANVMTACALLDINRSGGPTSCLDHSIWEVLSDDAPLREWLPARVETVVRQRLRQTYAEISQITSNPSIPADERAVVVMVGYPNVLSVSAPDQNCLDAYGLAFPELFTEEERQFMVDVGAQLNAVIADEAARAGFHFADPRDEFAGHEACTADEWIHGFVNVIQNKEYSFHPNAAGARAYARAVEHALSDRLADPTWPVQGTGLPRNPSPAGQFQRGAFADDGADNAAEEASQQGELEGTLGDLDISASAAWCGAAQPDAGITVTGSGFAPGSEVTVSAGLSGDPLPDEVVTADASGAIDVTFTAPAGVDTLLAAFAVGSDAAGEPVVLYGLQPIAATTPDCDEVAPQVTITAPLDGAVVAAGTPVVVEYDCTDDDELLACEGPVPSGAEWPLDPGVHTLSVTAIDGADNTTTETVTFEVEAAPVYCQELEATIVGTDGNDTIVGTSGDDVIWAGPGRDTVEGLGGDDVVCGGDGHDVVDAGPGFDVVVGESGPDELSGGPDDDLLIGGVGGDMLSGDAGTDILLGDDQADILTGGDDADRIEGGSGPDVIDGGAGHDTIDAGDGGDIVSGGDGDDTVEGGTGPDEIDGQDGADVLTGDAGTDTIRGGADPDRIDGGRTSDSLYGDEGDDTLDGGAGHDHIEGGSGNDGITAGGGNDVLAGGDGSDVIDAGGGDDTIEGGPGGDDIDGRSGNDTVAAGDDDDQVRGGGGDDQITGDAGADALEGSPGDDTIEGGPGGDTIDAHSGDDVVISGDGADTVNGGNGNDLIDGDAGDDTLRGNSDNDTIDGGDGDD